MSAFDKTWWAGVLEDAATLKASSSKVINFLGFFVCAGILIGVTVSVLRSPEDASRLSLVLDALLWFLGITVTGATLSKFTGIKFGKGKSDGQ